jgi:ZIP family zinc transporter
MNLVLMAFSLSLLAGLATGLGGLIAVIRQPEKRHTAFLMGLAAGVMLTLSFIDLVNEAWQASGYLVTTIGFGLGALFMFFIDSLTPHIHFGEKEDSPFDGKMLKTGLLMAFGITVHNIPEGIAVGAGFMHLPEFGFLIALGIALHNIPEGIATALPLYESGVGRRKSFRIAFLSGLAEPIGALIAALFLTPFKGLIPMSLAFAAGVMVFITLDELIPTAREFGHQHTTAIGIITGTLSVFLLSGLLGV